MGNFTRLSVLLILLCGLPIVTTAQAPGGIQSSPPPIGKLVDVGGYKVHLYCTGGGSPTVVIVGAGFSFDWGLVQPEVARFTQVCSYDHSGSAWSDDGPTDSCTLRVSEIHNALKNAGIKGPYVLVGHSLGGLIARLYAGQYSNETAGVVFVDHALAMISRRPPTGGGAPAPPPLAAFPTSLPSSGKTAMGVQDDPTFSKLSAQDRELHRWGTAQTSDRAISPDNVDMLADCVAQADASIKDQSHPLGDKPLVDITAGTVPPLPPPIAETWHIKYAELQTKLLSLSGNSKQFVTENSGHFVMIDRPDVVVDAINQVVRSVRNGTKL
jgi:pimeloyl-ACP methyl ester carboxylesterase